MDASLALNVSSNLVVAHRRSKLGMLLAWRRNGLMTAVSPITSKPASEGRIKTSHFKVLISYQVN
jgi:hypothetical protein